MADAPSPEWVRLKRGNNWGNMYYAVEPLDRSGFARAERGIKVRAGDPVDVRWPDGAVVATKIVLQPHRDSVGDHGNRYDVTSNRIGVALALHGSEAFIEITEVDVPRSWVESMTPESPRG